MALTLDDIDRSPGPGGRIARVSEVETIGPYALRVVFDDGLVRELDFEEWVHEHGGVFTPLRDPEYFARVHVEGSSIAWNDQADYDPCTLHGDEVQVSGRLPRLIQEYVREEARSPVYDKQPSNGVRALGERVRSLALSRRRRRQRTAA